MIIFRVCESLDKVIYRFCLILVLVCIVYYIFDFEECFVFLIVFICFFKMGENMEKSTVVICVKFFIGFLVFACVIRSFFFFLLLRKVCLARIVLFYYFLNVFVDRVVFF